jgi:hypothetical protein
MICVLRKLTVWNWEILLFDSSWKAKSNEIKVLFYHTNHLFRLYRRSELKTIWFAWYMSVPKKQSFRTSLDTSFILLCYTLLYFPTVFSELFSKTTINLLYDVISIPSSQYCTSLCYHVVLLSVIMLYFWPSQYCTSLCYHIVFSIMTYFLCKITRGRILP